jgi:hypothetical protein
LFINFVGVVVVGFRRGRLLSVISDALYGAVVFVV